MDRYLKNIDEIDDQMGWEFFEIVGQHDDGIRMEEQQE
jgi:hypothetical protein